MAKSHLTSALLTLITTFAVPAFAGNGDWISSGGDAVACFASTKIAKAAEAQIAKEGHLGEPYLSQIVYAKSLDLIEIPKDELYSDSLNFKTFDDLLKARNTQIKAASPLFAFYAQLFDSSMNSKAWKPQLTLGEIDDSVDRSVIRQKYPECVLAQVFVRHSRSQADSKPDLLMDYQPKIWSKLQTPADQVALYYHELFYAIGREIGVYADVSHDNSNAVRFLVRVTMSDDFALRGLLRQETSIDNKAYRLALNRVYGDYVLLFFKDIKRLVPPDTTSQVPTQASRLMAFYRFVALTRKQIDEIKNEQAAKIIDQSVDARALVIHPQNFVKYVQTLEQAESEEASFVIFAYWIMDISQDLINAEHLFEWDLAKQPSAAPSMAQRRLIEDICDHLKDESITYHDVVIPVVKLSKKYCSRL